VIMLQTIYSQPTILKTEEQKQSFKKETDMKKNAGTIDRTLRVLVGLGLISYAVIDGATWGYLGIVPLFTGLIGSCPLYSLLGISTCGKCSDSSSGTACDCSRR